MNKNEQIYSNLCKIAPDFLKQIEENPWATAISDKAKESGLMPLHFEGRGNFNNSPMISLCHYYEQNGDLMSDPFMEIIIHKQIKAAEAQSFEMSYPSIIRLTYRYKNNKLFVNLKNKQDNNSFLLQWTRNLIRQGHRLIFPLPETTISY